jgi:monoamine oxidase
MVFNKVLLMAMLCGTTSLAAENKKPKVVVIGAGLAGLTTAYRLQQAGVDVEVYEARNRVGGRVFSVNVRGKIAELGGQNITDGGNAENLHRLIEEFGLELVANRVNLDRFCLMRQGLISIDELLKKKQFNPHELRVRLDELAVQCNNMREVLNGLLGEEDPLGKVLAVRLAAYEGGNVEKLSPMYIETLYHMLLGGICVAHQEDELKENYINIVSIKGGNGLLPEKMATIIGDRLHLHNSLVKVVKDDSSYVLTFSNGGVVNADIIVLANPCSTYGDIVFDENVISAVKLESIKNVQYGTNAKIFVPLSDFFMQKNRVMNDCVIGWLDTSSNAFVLYHTGDSSFFSVDSIADAYNKNGSKLFEICFPDECAFDVVPLVAQDCAFVSYNSAVGHSWPNDPYAKGSYSYIAAGQEALLTSMIEVNGTMVKELFAPINKTLYFAGEHASILIDVPGTMEAACESGERTAHMILNDIDSI